MSQKKMYIKDARGVAGNRLVSVVGNQGSGYKLCLFQFDGVSRKGNRAVTQPVRNDRLVDPADMDR